MSAEALAIALHHSRAKGTAKLVLLGIANHDGDGGAWPSIQTLSKYANVDVRSVQRSIEQLVALHEIKRVEGAGGRPNTPEYLRPNLYHFLLECPAHCDRSRQHRDTQKGARYVPRYLEFEEAPDPLAPASPGGASVTGPLAPASPDPLAPASPELNKEPAIETSSALDPAARTRADHKERSAPSPEPLYEPPPRCPERPTRPHAFNREHVCIDCGAPDPAHLEAVPA